MRDHGLMRETSGLGLNGHGCWSYSDEPELVAGATAFLEEGLALGQRLVYVGGESAERALREHPPTRRMLDEGVLTIVPFESIYPGGRRRPNPEQLAVFRQATDEAIAAGFSGLRVLAEVTALVDDEEGSAHAAWESFADREMASMPLAALCCFHRPSVPGAALGSIAQVHPIVDQRLAALAPFRVYADDGHLALEGHVDVFSAPGLTRALEAAGPDGAQITLDLTNLQFIDHHGALALITHAERLADGGGQLTFTNPPPVLQRLSRLLELDLPEAA